MELQVKLMPYLKILAETLVNYGQRAGGSYSVQIYSSTNVSSADDDAQGKHTFNLTNNVSSENGVQIVNGHNYDMRPNTKC